MTLPLNDLNELEASFGDRIYLQIANWRLNLGDAGLAKDLAITCSAKIDQGSSVAVSSALESLKVSVAGGKSSLPLSLFISSSQVKEIEEIVEVYCR